MIEISDDDDDDEAKAKAKAMADDIWNNSGAKDISLPPDPIGLSSSSSSSSSSSADANGEEAPTVPVIASGATVAGGVRDWSKSPAPPVIPSKMPVRAKSTSLSGVSIGGSPATGGTGGKCAVAASKSGGVETDRRRLTVDSGWKPLAAPSEGVYLYDCGVRDRLRGNWDLRHFDVTEIMRKYANPNDREAMAIVAEYVVDVNDFLKAESLKRKRKRKKKKGDDAHDHEDGEIEDENEERAASSSSRSSGGSSVMVSKNSSGDGNKMCVPTKEKARKLSAALMAYHRKQRRRKRKVRGRYRLLPPMPPPDAKADDRTKRAHKKCVNFNWNEGCFASKCAKTHVCSGCGSTEHGARLCSSICPVFSWSKCTKTICKNGKRHVCLGCRSRNHPAWKCPNIPSEVKDQFTNMHRWKRIKRGSIAFDALIKAKKAHQKQYLNLKK